MATWRQVMNGVVGIVTGAQPVQSPAIPVGIGWPARTAIEAVVAQSAGAASAISSVYDRGESRDATRWNRIQVASAITAPSSQVQPAQGSAAPGQTFSTTVYYAPALNDGIGISASNGALFGGVTALAASSGMTAAQLAAELAMAVNDDPVLSAMFSASTSGAQVNLRNISSRFSAISLGTGNIGQLQVEVSRKERRLQIVTWAATESALEAACDPVESALGDLQSSFGIQLADSTWCRIRLTGDIHRLDGIKEDAWRRDFLVSAEYGITIAQAAYSVLAYIPAVQMQSILQATPENALEIDNAGDLLEVDAGGDVLGI